MTDLCVGVPDLLTGDPGTQVIVGETSQSTLNVDLIIFNNIHYSSSVYLAIYGI